MTKSTLMLGLGASVVCLAALSATEADAQRRGGGGRSFAASRPSTGSLNRSSQVRSSASANVNRAGTRPSTGNLQSGNRVNAGNRTNINTGDVNISRNVDIDVDGGHGCCGWGDWDYHPVAAGVAVGTAVAVTTAWRLGAYYSALPTNCVILYRGSVAYYQCGTYWYQPVYSGMTVRYVAVVAP